jgi:hypothetical protein
VRAVPLTVLGPDACPVDGSVEGGEVLLDEADLEAAIGWRVEDRGLCRGEVCVPVTDPGRIRRHDRIDLLAVADVLGAPTVVDADRSLVAVGLPAFERRRVVADRDAVSVELTDLDGNRRQLAEWSRRRRLLVAFASW